MDTKLNLPLVSPEPPWTNIAPLGFEIAPASLTLRLVGQHGLNVRLPSTLVPIETPVQQQVPIFLGFLNLFFKGSVVGERSAMLDLLILNYTCCSAFSDYG